MQVSLLGIMIEAGITIIGIMIEAGITGIRYHDRARGRYHFYYHGRGIELYCRDNNYAWFAL